jgi:AraC-like DNA-binding protein
MNFSNIQDRTQVTAMLPDIRIHVARFRRVEEWLVRNLSAPHWRLYWNLTAGAELVHGDRRILLTSSNIHLIPPNTRAIAEMHRPFEHFFIHFTLANDFVLRAPRVYSWPVEPHTRGLLKKLPEVLRKPGELDPFGSSVLHALITDGLARIPRTHWRPVIRDQRVRRALALIASSKRSELNNQILAKAAHMSTNGFIRLFRLQMGMGPMRYFLMCRLDAACSDLIHSDDGIEQIARRHGFADRNYFTRMLKRYRLLTPGEVRRMNAV